MKCPKCHFDNPSDAKFCKECGTQLILQEEIPITETLETPAEELTRGTTFAGRYEIIKELGRGGMGVVYKAQDTKLKRTVALKFLPPELTHIPDFKERFMREAQAAAALDHPHICTVHELDEAEDKTFISMAYVKGQSLKKKIEPGPLELDEALRIAIQVAEGLQEAHKKGVVHRDIKSANIMVTEKGQAKIMDFGLARVTGGTLVTKEGMTMGTIAYMSPEQARGEEVDHRTDIWSLGVVLYEMFSGQLPFKGEHDQAVVYSILNEQPKPITDLRSGMPMTLEQMIGKTLEKKPDDRYQQIDELLDDLKSISEGIVPEGVRARLWKAKLLRRKRAILYAGITGLFIIMTVIALSLFTGHGEALDSIAVLPLENLSGDPDQEYFADGMTDALIAELGKIRELRVISRQSVMQYKGSTKPMPEIARELNVDGVVEGSVLLSGQKVRITAQLIEARKDRHLWSDNYNGDLRNVLLLQSDVARAIAREVKITVTQEEQARLTSAAKVNPEAYQLYLKGNFFLEKLTPEGIQKSFEHYQQAIKVDPNCAWAYRGIAHYFNMLGFYNFLSPKESFPKAKEAIEKALELDDSLAEAHETLVTIKLYYDWDWMGVERESKRAIELNPNSAGAHLMYGQYLTAVGKHDEAIAEGKRALELNPLSPRPAAALAGSFMMARRYEQAIEEFQRILKKDPNYWEPPVWLALIYMQKEMYDEATAVIQKGMKLFREAPPMVPAVASVYASSGKRDEARKILDELIELSKKRYVSPVWIALIFKSLGQNDEAFDWLEKAYEERDNWLIYFKVTPFFDSLRPDDRYAALLKKMGLE